MALARDLDGAVAEAGRIGTMSPVVNDVDHRSAEIGEQPLDIAARQAVHFHAREFTQATNSTNHGNHRNRQDALQAAAFDLDRQRIAGRQLKHQDRRQG